MKKVLAIFVLIMISVSLLSACGVTSSTGNGANAVSGKASYGVGETAVCDDYKITAESLNYVSSSNQFIQPDAGKKFIEVVLLIENTSDSELNVSSLLNFDAYLDDMAIDMDIMGQSASENGTMDGTVASGKKLRGSLCYQVPENWSKLEVNVNLDLFSKEEVVLLFENK